MPTYRFLHRETVESWLETIQGTGDVVDSGVAPVSNAKRALIILMLATAKLYNGEDLEGDFQDRYFVHLHTFHSRSSYTRSGTYYAAAERLLANETGKVTLEAVQARLSQCIYLLASSRVNHAWYVFGTTAQLIIALGLHRRQVYLPTNPNQSSILESRKRIFWSAYTLDRYLSVMLGRPRIFRDEDIDQPLPEQSDFSSNSSQRSGVRSKSIQSVDDGPIFHARSVITPAYTVGKSSTWTQALTNFTDLQKSSVEYPMISIRPIAPTMVHGNSLLNDGQLS